MAPPAVIFLLLHVDVAIMHALQSDHTLPPCCLQPHAVVIAYTFQQGCAVAATRGGCNAGCCRPSLCLQHTLLSPTPSNSGIAASCGCPLLRLHPRHTMWLLHTPSSGGEKLLPPMAATPAAAAPPLPATCCGCHVHLPTGVRQPGMLTRRRYTGEAPPR